MIYSYSFCSIRTYRFLSFIFLHLVLDIQVLKLFLMQQNWYFRQCSMTSINTSFRLVRAVPNFFHLLKLLPRIDPLWRTMKLPNYLCAFLFYQISISSTSLMYSLLDLSRSPLVFVRSLIVLTVVIYVSCKSNRNLIFPFLRHETIARLFIHKSILIKIRPTQFLARLYLCTNAQ